ncbi:hypothetical protein B0H14DRAFT_2736316 [Mycena olivaceomarginata]|nr:hypothetical protein B0H14DRAFT_2736316 [Mycena olivaceomarginata]
MSQSSGSFETLSSSTQRQVDVAGYVLLDRRRCVGGFFLLLFSAHNGQVLIWDILCSVRDEYSLLFKHKMSLVVVAYVFSRVGSLVYVLGFTIFATYPLKDCSAAYVAFNSFYTVSLSATAFLFLFRVRAIYGGGRLITVIFGILWLAVVATSITSLFAASVISFADPPQCIIKSVKSYARSSGIMITLYDTIVFLSISFRLVSTFRETQPQTRKEKLMAWFSGANMPAFSKALLLDGQMYYMFTVISNITVTIVAFIPSISPVHRSFLVVPNVAIMSIMGCRVYRNTKLKIDHGDPELSLPMVNPMGPNRNTIPLTVVQFASYHTGGPLKQLEGDESVPWATKSFT